MRLFFLFIDLVWNIFLWSHLRGFHFQFAIKYIKLDLLTIMINSDQDSPANHLIVLKIGFISSGSPFLNYLPLAIEHIILPHPLMDIPLSSPHSPWTTLHVISGIALIPGFVGTFEPLLIFVLGCFDLLFRVEIIFLFDPPSLEQFMVQGPMFELFLRGHHNFLISDFFLLFFLFG